MSSPQAEFRPTPTGEQQLTQRRRQSDRHDDDAAPLHLSRTRSQELCVVESIAVQEPEDEETKPPHDADGSDSESTVWPTSVRYLVLLCGFLTSLSFGVTQVPLLYVFRLMTCDAYYGDQQSRMSGFALDSAPRSSPGSILSYAFEPLLFSTGAKINSETDRCSIHPIESSTALSISLLGASTTVFGIVNLFLTSTLVKRIGVKTTLVIQIFFPALRLFVQNVGVEVWGSTGIIIVQSSQIVSIIGGPSGYLLVLNTYITEVVEYEGRTAALGRLTGSMMFGSATGFLLGGVVADAFGIRAPFRLTFILFLAACLYVVVALPYISPAEKRAANAGIVSGKSQNLISKFFGPLTVFVPQKFIRTDGVIQTEYGAFLLAWGLFLGILATGYLPTLLQLFSTDVFAFGTKQNGWLIFMYSMLRGVFLTFAFPKIIALGRRLTAKKEEQRKREEESNSPERQPLLATQQPPEPTHDIDSSSHGPKTKEQTFAFDLIYTRFSLLADGLLTLLCSCVREGWQMYLVAVVLPFAAGTGSASKGTILQMVGSAATSGERSDALAGVSLVENMARLSTTFVFGAVFAAFASIGRTELVFTCNAAVALVGFGVLLFARFPPEGSRRLDNDDIETSD